MQLLGKSSVQKLPSMTWQFHCCCEMHLRTIVIVKEGPISETVKAIFLEAFQDQIWKPTQDSMQWSRTSMRSREKKTGRHVWTSGLWQRVCGKLTDCSRLFQFSEHVISKAVIILCGPSWLHCTQQSEDNSLVAVKWRWSFPICVHILWTSTKAPKLTEVQQMAKALSTCDSYGRKNFKVLLCFYSHHLGLNC